MGNRRIIIGGVAAAIVATAAGAAQAGTFSFYVATNANAYSGDNQATANYSYNFNHPCCGRGPAGNYGNAYVPPGQSAGGAT